MMNLKKNWFGYLVIFLIIVAIYIFAFNMSSCDYFQKKTYMNENDCFGMALEMCLKGNKADNSSGGGNTKNCDGFIKAMTPDGRLETFKQCIDFERSNKNKLEKYDKFSCYDFLKCWDMKKTQ